MPLINFLLISIAIVLAFLFIAYLLIGRGRTGLALLLGLLVIGAFQIYLHRSWMLRFKPASTAPASPAVS